MKISFAVTSVLLVGAAAHMLDIPAVHKVVEEVLHSLANYTAYRGLTGIASAGPAAETASKPSNLQAIAAVADPAYWLANIAHQSQAGLNANPSTCPHGIP